MSVHNNYYQILLFKYVSHNNIHIKCEFEYTLLKLLYM